MKALYSNSNPNPENGAYIVTQAGKMDLYRANLEREIKAWVCPRLCTSQAVCPPRCPHLRLAEYNDTVQNAKSNSGTTRPTR